MPGHPSIHCTEWVIKEINVCLVVDCSGQTHSGLLSSTESHSSLTHQCQVTIYQLSDVLK